jgi:hypothetical protein
MFSIYHRHTRTSQEQLREDFGAFPPTPLQCKLPRSGFVIVRARGPGTWINYWRRSAELMRAFDLDRATVAPELLEAMTNLCKAEISGDRAPNQVQPHRGAWPRLFVRLTLIIVFRAFEKTRKRGLGYFLPITSQDRQITLLAGSQRKAGLANAVLAHEHLHFLQNEHALNPNKGELNLPRILAEPRAKDPFVLYLLEPLEVEARLHELVLSFYRARQMLPQTVDAFLGMLADWEEFGEFLTHVTAFAGLTMRGTGCVFPLRSAELGGQLGMVLGFLKDAETTRQFVTEVLPVMYGHLLQYYGDARASRDFLAQIARPNLYDALYGEKQPSVHVG